MPLHLLKHYLPVQAEFCFHIIYQLKLLQHNLDVRFQALVLTWCGFSPGSGEWLCECQPAPVDRSDLRLQTAGSTRCGGPQHLSSLLLHRQAGRWEHEEPAEEKHGPGLRQQLRSNPQTGVQSQNQLVALNHEEQTSCTHIHAQSFSNLIFNNNNYNDNNILKIF